MPPRLALGAKFSADEAKTTTPPKAAGPRRRHGCTTPDAQQAEEREQAADTLTASTCSGAQPREPAVLLQRSCKDVTIKAFEDRMASPLPRADPVSTITGHRPTSWRDRSSTSRPCRPVSPAERPSSRSSTRTSRPLPHGRRRLVHLHLGHAPGRQDGDEREVDAARRGRARRRARRLHLCRDQRHDPPRRREDPRNRTRSSGKPSRASA